MVIPVYGDNSYLEEVKKAGIPTVILEDTYGIRTIDMVQTDCASVSYQIVEELIQNGHQKIGIICGSRYSTTAKERLNGYLRVMEDYEIPLRKEYLIEGNYDYASGYEGIHKIRQLPDLERPMDGLILPGGESTAMRKLLDELGLYEPLRAKIAAGLPVYGTCAGLLLLAKEIEGGTPCFATMDVSAVRNAYGRQLGSFYTEAEFAGLGTIPMTFIRAPYIASVQKNVKVLATVDEKIVAARQGNQFATAFHPELNEDVTVHRYFLEEVCKEKLRG